MDTQIIKMDPPAWVVHHITKIGGTNLYGRPNFRVIWGGNRYHTVGGMFKKVVEVKDEMIIGKVTSIVTDVAEIRQLLKYNPFRWHLERWRGPEFYGTAEEWYACTWDEESQLHVMGDYPHEGDYEHVFYLGMCSHMKPGDTDWCMPCQVTSGEYIPLEENVSILEIQIRALQMTEDVSKEAEKAALFMRENVKRQVRRKLVEDRVRGAMRPQLAVQPTSWQDGTRCSVPEAKILDVQLPHNRVGFSQSNHVLPAHKQKDIEEN